MRPPRGSCGGGGGAARASRLPLAPGLSSPPPASSSVPVARTTSTPSPAPSAMRRRRRRRRRGTDVVRGEPGIGDAYPLRPSQNAAARGDEQLARACDDHPAARGAVALALDLAQDLAIHPGRGGHRSAAVEQERDARAAPLVEDVRARDLVAHEPLA